MKQPLEKQDKTLYAAFIGVAAGDDSAATPLAGHPRLADLIALILARPSFQYR